MKIDDFQLNGCEYGDLWMNIEMISGELGTNDYQFRTDQSVQVGIIACDTQCAKCSSEDPSFCLICSDPSYFVQDGVCKSTCLKIVEKREVHMGVAYDVKTCHSECPSGTLLM